jgi:hypothetical protein
VANGEAAAINNITFNPLVNNYIPTNLGGRVWPVAANLFGSTRPSLIVGNVLGGVQILNSEGPELPNEPVIDVFPNPVLSASSLNIRIDRPALMQIYSALGQEVSTPVRLQPFNLYTTSLPALSPGMYILRFSVGSESYSKKLIINR